MKKLTLYLKFLVNLLLVVLGIVIVCLVVPKLIRFFFPFVIGWIVAMIANPLVRFMEKRIKIVRKHSSAIIIVVVIAGIVGALYGIISVTVHQVISLIDDMPEIMSEIQHQFFAASDRLQSIYEMLPNGVQGVVDKLLNNLQQYGSGVLTGVSSFDVSSAGTFAKNIAEFFLMTIITVLSAYFFTAERDNLVSSTQKHLPQGVVSSYRLIAQNFKSAFGGYFKAQFKIMLILIGILWIGFRLMYIRYSFLLSLLIALLDFLPFFGTGAVLWPWAIVDAITGNYTRAIFLLALYLICQLVKQILQPKMVGDSIGLSPLATLFFMFIGYRLYSVIGMIIGIPVGMILVKFYQVGVFDNLIKGIQMIATDINEFRKY